MRRGTGYIPLAEEMLRMAPFFLETERYEQMLFYPEKKETLQPEINPRDEHEHGNICACRLNQDFSCRTSKKSW